MGFNIPDTELQWRFGPSGGPGGQHANRSNTRAELVFDITTSTVFDSETRRRLMDRLGPVVRITEDSSRSQAINRRKAEARLDNLLTEASAPDPPPRRATRPSQSSRQKRLDAKRARGRTKQLRKRPPDDE